MRIKDHIAIDNIVFGKGYDEVHEWLDELYPKYREEGVPFLHWKERHHYNAIKEKYGEGTIEYKVAYLHIMLDWLTHFGKFLLPLNEEEVIYYLGVAEVI